MCSLFLGVRCGFHLKRNAISLFAQAKNNKSNLNNKSPTPNSIPKIRVRPSIGIALI
jgi:hypothetical protein